MPQNNNYGEEIEIKEGSMAERLLDEKFDMGLWFQDKVLKMAPIWLASVTIHFFGILFLSLISSGAAAKPPDVVTVVDLNKKIPPPVEEIKEEFKEEEITKETTEEEILKPDVEVEAEVDDDSDVITNSPLKGKGVYDTIGIGGGLGGGRGRRGGRKKASKQSEDAVLAGLIWLARHQNADGSWGAKRFMNQCKGVRCSGPGDDEFDIGLTGVSLLAFTGAGYTPSSKDVYEGYNFGEVVRKAANYLMSIQDSQGAYGGVKAGKFLYNQTIATYSIADLYGLIKDSPTGVIFKDTAQKGVDYLISIQNPGKAWRYQPRDGQNDSSVSGWGAMAIKSADNAGLTVDPQVFASIKSFYEDVTDQTNGKVGYTELGSIAIKSDEAAKNPQIQPSLTAIGIMVRIFIDKKTSDPVLKKGVDEILQFLPTWDPSRLGVIDYYYWFYASYCLNQFDGPDGPCWKKWNEKLKEVLVKNQHPRADNCQWGSWDPIDRWGNEGSRIYSTAIGVLTLEVYYRLGITRH